MCEGMAGRSFLVKLSNDAGEFQKIIVQTPCPHGMQEFVDGLTDLKITHPVVIDIEELTGLTARRHIPIIETS